MHNIALIVLITIFISITMKCPSNHHHHTHKPTTRSAISILYPDNNSGVKGIVTMHQKDQFSPTFFEFTVVGLQSNQLHGCHIHQFGDLTKGCQTAGAHFNPYNQTHGGPQDMIRHVGDLGNLLANKNGIAQTCLMDRMVNLYGPNSVLGRSIVVHKREDDLGRGDDQQSLKTGNAGTRLACGIIGLASQFKHYNPSDIK